MCNVNICELYYFQIPEGTLFGIWSSEDKAWFENGICCEPVLQQVCYSLFIVRKHSLVLFVYFISPFYVPVSKRSLIRDPSKYWWIHRILEKLKTLGYVNCFQRFFFYINQMNAYWTYKMNRRYPYTISYECNCWWFQGGGGDSTIGGRSVNTVPSHLGSTYGSDSDTWVTIIN